MLVLCWRISYLPEWYTGRWTGKDFLIEEADTGYYVSDNVASEDVEYLKFFWLCRIITASVKRMVMAVCIQKTKQLMN